jgi:hypothetical protein
VIRSQLLTRRSRPEEPGVTRQESRGIAVKCGSSVTAPVERDGNMPQSESTTARACQRPCQPLATRPRGSINNREPSCGSRTSRVAFQRSLEPANFRRNGNRPAQAPADWDGGPPTGQPMPVDRENSSNARPACDVRGRFRDCDASPGDFVARKWGAGERVLTGTPSPKILKRRGLIGQFWDDSGGSRSDLSLCGLGSSGGILRRADCTLDHVDQPDQSPRNIPPPSPADRLLPAGPRGVGRRVGTIRRPVP